MPTSIKRFAVVGGVLAALALPACGALDTDSEATNALKARLSSELTTQRKFTNVTIEWANTTREAAGALASVGGCRLRLTWSARDSWKLDGDSQIDDLTGELTAEQVRTHEKYQTCAKLPAPTESSAAPTPNS